MRRFVTVVASKQAYLGWGRSCLHLVITLLILHLLGSVKAWNNVPNVSNGYCQTQMDCFKEGWTDPLPACEGFRCLCPSGTCAVYTSDITGYLYFCGSCGMLGSECSNNTDCMADWQCVNSFCECDKGSAYRGVCLYYGSLPTFVSSIVLTSVFIIMVVIIIVKLVCSMCKTPRKACCWSSSDYEDESRVVASNPRSNDKTAAFTITNSDFIATEEDPDLALALERSRYLADYIELDTSTLSTTRSSMSLPDPRFTSPRPPAQPGTSGWRPSPNGVGTQPRSSRASLSSTSSSRYCRSSSGTVSSYSSTLPSASLHSSFTSSSRPSPSLTSSDEVSLPKLESLRIDFEDGEFETTRV